jgi:plasmid stabilization system protein ParE
MSYRILITKSARSQIIGSARYIAESSQSLPIAERWLERVLSAADTLADFPHRCPLAPENDFRSFEIRRMLIGVYLLLFTIVEKDRTVIVIGLRHGSQLPRPDELPDEVPPTETE